MERPFGWASRFRRLARDYERLATTLAGLHYVAYTVLMLKSAAPRLTGFDASTSCNRMEMIGVIAGLKAAICPSRITVYSDSQLDINRGSGRWKRKKNLDLWKRLDAAAGRQRVEWRTVNGHNRTGGTIWPTGSARWLREKTTPWPS